MNRRLVALGAALALCVSLAGCGDDGVTPPVTPADKWFVLPQLNNIVGAMTIYNGDLIVGGSFTQAGATAVSYLARWDGSAWHNLGGGVSGGAQGITLVSALGVYNGKLIVGGRFTMAGGVSANNIAAWDGSAWSALGSGLSVSTLVEAPYAFAVHNGHLYVGGDFDAAGGTSVHNLARWDGAAWYDVGGGVTGGVPMSVVYGLAEYGGNLAVGGNFTSAGAVAANSVASWSGSAWTAFGSGIGGALSANPVFELLVFGGNLVAAGEFTTAGGAAANRIASWNGSAWSTFGSGMSFRIEALCILDNKLVAGGMFTSAGGTAASRIARWDGSSWKALGKGVSGGIFGLTGIIGLAVYDDKIVAGGNFTKAGTKTAGHIAGWAD